MAPVAKRNFCRRHDHGLGTKSRPDDADGEDIEDEEEDDPMEEGDYNLEGTGGEAVLERLQEVKEQVATAKKAKRKRGLTEAENAEGFASAKRRSMWSDLLARRPQSKDPRNLSSWLNEVLTVSDLDFPIEEQGANGHSSSSASTANVGPVVVEDDVNGDSSKADEGDEGSGKKPKAKKAKAEKTDKAVAEQSREKSDEKTEKYSDKVEAAVEKPATEKADTESKVVEETPQRKKVEAETESGTKTEEGEVDAKETEGGEKTLSPSAVEDKPKEKDDEEEGFAGSSFADWKKAKKGKGLKKGPGLLRK